MNTTIRNYGVMLFLATCLFSASAQSVHISTDQRQYLVYEPVFLRISSQTRGCASLEEHECQLIIVRPDGLEITYRPPAHFDSFGVPNFDRVAYSTITISSGSPVFDKPGSYSLRLWSLCPDESCAGREPLSNEIVLSFDLPQTSDDVSAYKLIATSPASFGLFAYLKGGDHIAEGYQIAREVANLDSRYSDICRFLLSCNWARPHYDYATGQLRPARMEKAAEYAQCRNPLAPAYIRLANAAALKSGMSQLQKDGLTSDAQTEADIGSLVGGVRTEVSAESSALYRYLGEASSR